MNTTISGKTFSADGYTSHFSLKTDSISVKIDVRFDANDVPQYVKMENAVIPWQDFGAYSKLILAILNSAGKE